MNPAASGAALRPVPLVTQLTDSETIQKYVSNKPFFYL